MEVILTGILVVLTGYTFVHPSVENGQYSVVVHQNQIYKMNTRDGTFEKCEPPIMKCVPTGLQIQNDSKSLNESNK